MKQNFLFFLLFFIALNSTAQVAVKNIDTLEFQIGYPNKHTTALQQLQSYPSPRYQANTSFIRLFNWMNSRFMAGAGQSSAKEAEVIKEAIRIQEELILNWNYFITIQNSGMASNKMAFNNPSNMLKPYVELANKYPQIPLAVTTFWMQLSPAKMGFTQKTPYILKKDFPASFYIKDAAGKMERKIINFAAPDSIFIKDGQLQKICLQNILTHLTRPINIINENGEEPPGAQHINITKKDKDVLADKNKSGISDWNIYASKKKTHMRNLYSDQFMKLPELKNTWFTIYNVEGGPINRFDWSTSKTSCSSIKGNYYSTPDFYPRTPNNWKTWKGAWHGWKWINDGRTIEIKNGDKFFSPYVAAGWSFNPENDIRPAQWLGLLKCLSVAGAEFYYTGYFNLKKPYTQPQDYVWQAAMPAYAQAVSTHYADVFFKGNVLFDHQHEPIVTYPVNDPDVLVTVRKHDTKEKYIIAATVQPSSNTEKFPVQKNIQLTIAGDQIKIKARRQGSVYVYDKSVEPALFYQLDRWHQYEHPERWRKEWICEAEVADTASSDQTKMIRSVYLKSNSGMDCSLAESYIQMNQQDWTEYSFSKRDANHLGKNLVLMIYAKCSNQIRLNATIFGNDYIIASKKTDNWEWIVFPFEINSEKTLTEKIRIFSLTEGVLIDKIIITNSNKIPDLKDY